ncbi:unnamed protein product, partial [Iphiclides podalirius]
MLALIDIVKYSSVCSRHGVTFNHSSDTTVLSNGDRVENRASSPCPRNSLPLATVSWCEYILGRLVPVEPVTGGLCVDAASEVAAPHR